MRAEHLEGVAALQPLAFPPPFPSYMHWDPEDLAYHIAIFPEGQFVALHEGEVVGSCSNTRTTVHHWEARSSWMETVGGPRLENFDPSGQILYGLDISVHPAFRRLGIARAFYAARFDWVRANGALAYGTICRIPDYADWELTNHGTPEEFADAVVAGEATDRTLTPLLRFDLQYKGVFRDYMEDSESHNAGAILEWRP